MLKKILEVPQRVVRFYGDGKSELKKVTWPSRKEVYGTTISVILTVLFFGAYLLVVDLMLKNAVEWMLGGIGEVLS
mgnify:CR=1 FL=1